MKRQVITKVFLFPRKIDGKWYWLKPVKVEETSYIIHGKEDGCATDIWLNEFRVISKLEDVLK